MSIRTYPYRIDILDPDRRFVVHSLPRIYARSVADAVYQIVTHYGFRRGNGCWVVTATLLEDTQCVH